MTTAVMQSSMNGNAQAAHAGSQFLLMDDVSRHFGTLKAVDGVKIGRAHV